MYFQGPSNFDNTAVKSRFMIAFFESDGDFYSFINNLNKTYPKAGHSTYIVTITGGKVCADQLDLIHTIIKQINDPISKYFLPPKNRSVLSTVEIY